MPTRHSGKFGDAIDREVGQTWLLGGIAIVLGLGTRPVAFILSGMMAVAYWQFHAPNGVSPVQNQGVPAVLFCFLYLYMVARGGGDWSLDALLRREKTERIAKAG